MAFISVTRGFSLKAVDLRRRAPFQPKEQTINGHTNVAMVITGVNLPTETLASIFGVGDIGK